MARKGLKTVLMQPTALALQLAGTATGQGGVMSGESGAASIWAALLGLSFFIASTVTAGYWLCVYHDEAEQVRPYLEQPCTTIEMIWEDIPVPGRI
jgi:uncharacterized membrane protein YedE/YeeE